MFGVELRELRASLGKFPDRQNEGSKHPAIGRAHIGRLILQRRFEREIGGREKPGVVDGVSKEGA